MRRPFHFGMLVALTCLAWAQPVRAVEPFAEFIKALQSQGYGEEALFYLDQIEQRSDIPVALRQTLDLERSKSLRFIASATSNAEKKAAYLAEANKFLDKFKAEYPNHPGVATGYLSWGDELVQKGQQRLGQVRGSTDANAKAKADTEARELFEDAKRQFAAAQAAVQPTIDAMPKPAGTARNPVREELELFLVEARFKLALADFLMATTLPKDATHGPERSKLLAASAKAFDSLFQEYRGSRLGYLGHLWHGRTLEESGDKDSALDTYDEVIVATPDGKDVTTDDAQLFGQAALFRMQLLESRSKWDDILEDADGWLASYKRWHKTSAYQGIALIIAKSKIAETQKKGHTLTERKKLLRDVSQVLADIGKSTSEFRFEAIALRRQVLEELGKGDELLSLDEMIAMADASAGESRWSEAFAAYQAIVPKLNGPKDEEKLKSVMEKIVDVRYRMAVELYNTKKFDEALAELSKIVRESPKSTTAHRAASMAIASALQLHLTSSESDKEATFTRLEKVAKFSLEKNADFPEADDARMGSAQAHLKRGEQEQGLTYLTQVQKTSSRFATAQQFLGQYNWSKYLDAKRAANDDDARQHATALRAKALESLQVAFDSQKKLWNEKSEPLPPELFEAQLLLADIHMESLEFESAAKLYTPLASFVVAQKPASLDAKMLRAFIGSVRSSLAVGDVATATRLVEDLVPLSPDESRSNSFLVDFLKLLHGESKRLETNAESAQANSAGQELLKASMTKVVRLLAARKHFTVEQLIYLGDVCAAVKLTDESRDVYQRVVQAVEAAQGDKAEASPAITRVRAKLVGLLRHDGKFEEAKKQVDELIKSRPNALEPLMEKGRILQALAEKDPKKYEECLTHWTEVRVLLGRMRTRPPEYYEALLNAATCLTEQAKTTKDPKRAALAEQMLKSTLTLSPRLSGPEMVSEFQSLIKSAHSLQAKSK